MIEHEGARNIAFVGRSDQGGRGDGVQMMVARGHAYAGTRVSRGGGVHSDRDGLAGPRMVENILARGAVHFSSWPGLSAYASG